MKTGICYLFGAAPVADARAFHIQKRQEDLLICADGGFRLAKALRLEPDLVIGDFDSGEKPADAFTVEYPEKKDETDMLLAARSGLAQGYTEFRIYGGLGGRFDHSMANIQLLVYLAMHNARGVLLDARNEIRLLCDKDFLRLAKKPDSKLSLLALSDRCTGVTTKGLAYPLSAATLTNDFPLGVSNFFVEDAAEIRLESGKLLVILSKD